MDKIVQLDNTRHGGLRLLTGHGAAFDDAVNQARIFVSEFEQAQRHYPILFRKDEEGNLHALVVLGFERDENLFLEGAAWDGYVPAIVRRGPLSIDRGEDGEGAVFVDLGHPRVREGGSEGAPLFREHGGDAPALEAAMAALHQMHRGLQNAARMQQMFEDLALIEPIKLEVQTSEAKAVNFEGFMAVNGERIASLSGEQLARLNEADLLAPAIFAASSLANMRQLIARKQRRDGEAAG